MAVARFLHAADLHLGAPLQSLGAHLDQETAARVRQLARTAWDRLIAVAIAYRVDAVVLAGDVYDTADRDPGAAHRVSDGFRRLAAEGIGVFVAHGNHDPLTTEYLRTAGTDRPAVVFPPGDVETHRVEMSNGVELTIAGISYSRTAERDNLALRFASVSGRPVVGVLHTNVGGDTRHDDYAPCTPQDLESMPVDYWALGHIHDRQVHPTRRGYWAYPGNLQGRSTKATECGAKGALLVGVDGDGRILEPEFIACDAVRFERVDVDLGGLDDTDEAFDRIRSTLAVRMADVDDRFVLVRLEVTGATPLSDQLHRSWESIVEHIGELATETIVDGALLKVVNTSTPAVDLLAARRRPNLLGGVLNALDAVDIEDPDQRARVERILVRALDGSR